MKAQGLRSGRWTAAITAAALLAVLALAVVYAGGARAGVRAPAPQRVSSGAAASAQRVASFWTPQRMRQAKPIAPVGAPAGHGVASASHTAVVDPAAAPYRVNGRVFVRLGRELGFCSGTAINSPSRRLVLTAGHCVNTGGFNRRHRGRWFRYLTFAPAYNNGQAPFGTFVAQNTYALAPWIKRSNPNFDIGAAVVFPNENGQSVADAVGGVSVATNLPREQEFQIFGYPGGAFGSREMRECDSAYIGDDRATSRLGGPASIGVNCDMAAGASGGGWLIDQDRAINGVTSHGYRGDHVHFFGPYFGSQVDQLIAGL